jgi:serpin B
MHLPKRIVAAVVLALCGACMAAEPQRGAASDNPRETRAGSRLASRPAREGPSPAIVSANNAFAVDIYGRLRGREGNLALSPASISVALGMTYAGARGETAAQIARVLHFEEIHAEILHGEFSSLLAAWNDPDRTEYELRVANRLFGDRSTTFHDAFIAVTREQYGAPLEQLDFRGAPEPSRGRINAWVEKETNDRIRDLLPQGSIDAETRLVLTNAIYFKGQWRDRFDEELTRPLPFHPPSGSAVDVPTMYQQEKYGYAKLDGLKVLRMPYVGDDLAMYVLLPTERDGIGDLEERLTLPNLERWIGSTHDREIRVWLPRFTIDPPESVSLEETLGAMGMPLAFSGSADFTGMSDVRPPLFIDDAYHKAFVEVNEEGTEAAAATGVVVGVTSAPPREPLEFRADHPFLFLIRDLRSGSILFMGRVLDPSD